MPDIDQTLSERNKTHGDFGSNAWVAQQIKDIIRLSPNHAKLARDQREALDMIASKIGRIMSGNPDEPDHWIDIAGYSTLIARVRKSPCAP